MSETKYTLRVWHIPQVPLDPYEEPFYVFVSSPDEAVKVLDILAQYDIYQYENNIKPNYSNASGLETLEDGKWTEWYHPSLDCDIDEYKEILEDADND